MIMKLGGGAGGELTVNAPAGVTVIAVNNSTSKTYSKVADASGMAVFKGLPEGTYSVRITDGQQSTDPIQVTVKYKASASITWFSATINVTYPSGSTCTCSNGSTVYTAGNTSGSWTFTVPRAGTWTVTATNGSQTKSQAVSITTTGQSASVTLTYNVYLFESGSGATVNFRSYTSDNASVTISPNAITVSKTSGERCGANVVSDWINLNGYTKLVVQCNLDDVFIGYYNAKTGISTSNVTSFQEASFAASVTISSKGTQTLTVDIASLTGGYFVFGNYAYGTISNIWLEPA